MARLTTFERWWVNALPHRWFIRRNIPRFLRTCPEPFRGVVLEIGAGRGWTSRRILETFPQVELVATDADPDTQHHFDTLRRTYGKRLTFQQADVVHLPFDREAFDIVIAVNVMSYLRGPALGQALQQMLRVVRQGGLLGISDFLLIAPAGRPNRHTVEQLLAAEQCTIAAAQGDKRYILWARKAYPV